jgi:hypothetical protein
MNTSGTVTLARCTTPFHGRTTSRRNQAESPRLAIAARTAPGASGRRDGSAARRGASANSPAVPIAATATPAASWTSFSHDWPGGIPGSGKFERRSRRKSPATTVATPAAPISAGPHPGRGARRRSSAAPKATVHAPSARNPAVITSGSVASRAASPLMCSSRIRYSSWRRPARIQAIVNAAGPTSPATAPIRPLRTAAS